MKNNSLISTLKNNGKFVLIYRLIAFLLITLGIYSSLRIFSDDPNPYALFTYTLQSNLLVWIFFLISIIKTIQKLRSGNSTGDYGFHSVFSFSVCIAIVVTFLIFWLYLAPSGWMKNRLLSFRNLSIHFFCPVLMVLDRVLFYKKGVLKKPQVLYMLIFPLVYVAQSFILGLNHIIWFEDIGVNSYYIYPFLDFDAYGPLVFVFLLGLTAAFLGISYLWYFFEAKAKQK